MTAVRYTAALDGRMPGGFDGAGFHAASDHGVAAVETGPGGVTAGYDGWRMR